MHTTELLTVTPELPILQCLTRTLYHLPEALFNFRHLNTFFDCSIIAVLKPLQLTRPINSIHSDSYFIYIISLTQISCNSSTNRQQSCPSDKLCLRNEEGGISFRYFKDKNLT